MSKLDKNRKKGLGSGVNVLFSSDQMNKFNSSVSDKGELVLELPVKLIKPNPDQPRRVFDDESIKALADSIDKAGLLQPVSVKQSDGDYYLIAGERRLRAVKSLGKKTIKAIIINADEVLSAELALIENLQREDLNPIDEANAYVSLIDKYGMTHDAIAEVVGKSRAHISNLVRLLNLNKDEKQSLRAGAITVGHGKVLLSIKDKKLRDDVYHAVLNKGISVRQAEKLAASKPLAKEEKNKVPVDSETLSVQSELEDILGTKVVIKQKSRGFGSVIIDFYSDEDRERIINLLFHVEQ